MQDKRFTTPKECSRAVPFRYKTAVVVEEVPLGAFINGNNVPPQVIGDIQVVGVGSGPNQDYDAAVTTTRSGTRSDG